MFVTASAKAVLWDQSCRLLLKAVKKLVCVCVCVRARACVCCRMRALKGLACCARVTPVSSHASPYLDEALTSPACHACGCATCFCAQFSPCHTVKAHGMGGMHAWSGLCAAVPVFERTRTAVVDIHPTTCRRVSIL